jgi:hypothetical protein
VPTAIQTASYAAAVDDLAKFDISGGSISQNLPNAPADKSLYAAKIVKTAGTNTLTLHTQGSDVINLSGGSTSYTLKLLNQAVLLQYQATGGIWNVLGDDLPLSQLDARYPQSGAYVSTSQPGIAPGKLVLPNEGYGATAQYVGDFMVRGWNLGKIGAANTIIFWTSGFNMAPSRLP